MSPSPQITIRKTDVGKRRRIEKNIESLKQNNIDYNNIVGHQAEDNFNSIYEMITPIDLKINHVIDRLTSIEEKLSLLILH